MDIFSVFTLIGGIGMFLYGISLLGSSLEKLAGSGLEKILEKLTTSKKKGVGAIKGYGLGLGVTGVIQNSAATTIMLIGFVNAGIMTLLQAIPVVYGSQLGSTVTAQIIRLGDLNDSSFFLKMLKPASFAPIIVGIGAFIRLFSKKKKTKDIAGILIGFGLLFIGMTTMENVFVPLRESENFKNAFTSFENPILGVLIGFLITAIIQSSNASIGILQAMTATGNVTYSLAIPVVIGANLGKCITVVLGSFGITKKAKRVSLTYLLFNIIGAVIFLFGIYSVNAISPLGFMHNAVNRGNIANFHSLFNIITAMLLMPLTKKMEQLTCYLIREDEEDTKTKALSTLDPMLLNTPTVALEQCKKVIFSCCDTILENYKLATGMIYNYNEKDRALIDENENFIDKCESVLSSYLLQITSKRLTKDDRKRANELLNCVSDFERMGDHCVNIAYLAQSKAEQNISFSPKGKYEVMLITSAVLSTLETTFEAFKNDDITAASRVEPLEQTVDIMKDTIKSHHIERLQAGTCGVPGGIALVDLVTDYERISSHCANIALHIVKKNANIAGFDPMHGHIADSRGRNTEEYKALLLYYQSQYIDPLENEVPEEYEKAPSTKEELIAEIEAKEKETITKIKEKEKEKEKKHKKSEEYKEKKEDKKVLKPISSYVEENIDISNESVYDAVLETPIDTINEAITKEVEDKKNNDDKKRSETKNRHDDKRSDEQKKKPNEQKKQSDDKHDNKKKRK